MRPYIRTNYTTFGFVTLFVIILYSAADGLIAYFPVEAFKVWIFGVSLIIPTMCLGEFCGRSISKHYIGDIRIISNIGVLFRVFGIRILRGSAISSTAIDGSSRKIDSFVSKVFRKITHIPSAFGLVFDECFAFFDLVVGHCFIVENCRVVN